MNKKGTTRHRGKHLSKVSRKLLKEYFFTVIAFTLGLILFAFAAQAVCHQFIWYDTDLLYPLLKLIKDHLALSITAALSGIWLLITYRFASRLLHYLDEVGMAAEQLAAPTSEPIVLPDAISYMENEMNLVREKALNSVRAAKEAERRKNDLVVYLAHDLKTPLTSVIGYLTLLHDESQISEELRKKYLSISLEKAERLEELINEFFEITRFNLSEITLEYSRVNLTRLLEQLTYEFQPMLLEKNLNCILNIAPDTMITCDVNKMQRVFDNLLRNAVNYSFVGGTIQICAVQEHNDLHITFRNEGNTIPPEKLGRIFEQFYRLDTARSSKSGGAGLGLAIAKEIIEHHHGTITARSANELIEFEVTLPLS